MYCSNCGTQNPDDAAFCSNCGTAIQPIATATSQPTAQTPTGAPIRNQLASRWLRFVAKFLDTLILVGLFLVPFFAMAVTSAGVILFVATPGFLVMQAVWLSTSGQTIGKRIVGIKIVSAKTGENLGFASNVLLRAWIPLVLNLVLSGIFGPIDAALIFREDKRCIHDLIAGTSVVNA